VLSLLQTERLMLSIMHEWREAKVTRKYAQQWKAKNQGVRYPQNHTRLTQTRKRSVKIVVAPISIVCTI
jgi:hypothetical protein